MEKICVAVRVRPPVTKEIFNGTFWNVEDNHVSLYRQHGIPISGLSFAFDHVFDKNCGNARVYELLTKDIIHAAVEGFNGTVIAYGQTDSGKTFTMTGSSSEPGIIPLAVRDVFDNIHMMSDREFLIRVSYMEIYNEEINDLLTVENQKLPIHESLECGIFVAGLRKEIANSAEQVIKLIESGEVNRHLGETNMNVRSSRSHTIFRMVIESKGKETNSSGDYSSSDAIRVSVLNLVDLSGLKRIAKIGADGVRLKEGKYINKSLMVLGNVINKLGDGAKQRGHIPYRDSKLTRILQHALGGNAKTSIICTIAPEEVHIEETKGTLQFASRAKRITNCAQVNEILTDAALLKRQKLEIEKLRSKLQGSHSEVWEQEILKLRNDMLKYELEREKLETELQEERTLRKERDECIREQQLKIQNSSIHVMLSDSDRSSSQIDMEKLVSYSDDLVKVLKDKRDIDTLTQCLDHSKSLHFSCDADLNQLLSSIQDYQRMRDVCKQKTEQAKSEVAAEAEVDHLQKELEEEFEKDHALQEELRVITNEMHELEHKRISIEERKQALKKSEKDDLRTEMMLSMYTSVTQIIPDLNEQSKVSGCIVDKDKNVVEKFEYDPAKMTDFDICQSIWKAINSRVESI